MGAERGESNAEDWGGYVPVLIDGSVVVTPKHNEFDGRLHTAMRLCDLTVVDAYVTTNEEGETLKRFSFGPGQLAVADRGFANPVGIANVLAQGADVLVRVNRGALPLYALNGDPIDLLGWVRTLKSGRVSSRQVVTESGAARESCGRLLAKRIPREKREAARARARKEFGDDPIALELSEWVLLFTTASSAKLPDAQVMRLYACRWQIELLFKRMKSLCHLDKLPNFRPDTVVSWLGIKLLLFMCLEKLAQPVTDGLSPPADSTASARRPSHACTPTLEADDVAMASRRRRAHAHVAA